MFTPLDTCNKFHGFYGTTRHLTRLQLDALGVNCADQALTIGVTLEARWAEASHGLMLEGFDADATRWLLDSSWGIHLAEQMADVSTGQLRTATAHLVANQTGRHERNFNELVTAYRCAFAG